MCPMNYELVPNNALSPYRGFAGVSEDSLFRWGTNPQGTHAL